LPPARSLPERPCAEAAANGKYKRAFAIFRSKMVRILASLALAAALAACTAHGASRDALLCPGESRATSALQMLFGRAIGTQGEVTEEDWRDFAATTLTPHFPDGLTVFDGSGQFRDAGGTVVRERAKIVLVVVSDAAGAMARAEAVAAAYKQRFRQESVGIVVTPACARFR
jgi:hypothetical protein